MQPDEENQQQTGPNSAPLVAVLFCCLICLFSIVLCVYGMLVYVVLTSAQAGDSACASESNIWMYCLTAIIVLPIISCLFSLLSSLSSEQAKLLTAIPNIIGIVVAVWGLLLWVNISKDCAAYYTEDYPTLLFLFYVLVTITVITFTASICSFCCMIVLLTASVSSSGTTSRYDDIPDDYNPFQQNTNTGYQGVPQDGPVDASKLETEEYV
mmetsp:Transcript_20060/g.47834  ORF Transcript_20060/g.47834 Transcript_20060/m.47834 type:complete len:211 (+) Transcript_20060:99-731(+)